MSSTWTLCKGAAQQPELIHACQSAYCLQHTEHKHADDPKGRDSHAPSNHDGPARQARLQQHHITINNNSSRSLAASTAQLAPASPQSLQPQLPALAPNTRHAQPAKRLCHNTTLQADNFQQTCCKTITAAIKNSHDCENSTQYDHATASGAEGDGTAIKTLPANVQHSPSTQHSDPHSCPAIEQNGKHCTLSKTGKASAAKSCTADARNPCRHA